MITLTLKVELISYVAGLLGRKIDNPLYKRMSANILTATGMTDEVTVDLTEAELNDIMLDLTVAPEGISGLLNKELEDALAIQVAAGITAEGPDEEEVLDEFGDPIMRETSPTDPTLIPVTRPQQWARIYLKQVALTASNQAKRTALITKGYNYLIA